MEITKKFTIVDFSGGGDGITALYIDGELHHYGDDYHDDIRTWVNAFIEGVEYGEIKVTVERISLEAEDPWVTYTGEDGGMPPKKLEDLKLPPKD